MTPDIQTEDKNCEREAGQTIGERAAEIEKNLEARMLAVAICSRCERMLGTVGSALAKGPCRFCGNPGPIYKVNLPGNWGKDLVYECTNCDVQMHFPKQPRFKRCPECLKQGALRPLGE